MEPARPVMCGNCRDRFPVSDLNEDDRQSLVDQHDYQGFVEELRMLLKVRAFYSRHPEVEGRIKPQVTRVLESDDPQVVEQLWAGVPFDEIQLPPEDLPPGIEDTAEDREAVDYLRHNGFDVAGRIEFVSEEVLRLRGSVKAVACPRCGAGRLHVPPEEWGQFAASDSITWYWPEWHSLDSDGVLHVKTTGWELDSHWTGETTIERENSEYDFWCWFVAQEKHRRLVNSNELPAIRQEWKRQLP